MRKKGFFITLEGGEACGKSTQMLLLENSPDWKNKNQERIFTRSPGGTRIAETIRGILKFKFDAEPLSGRTEILLFSACHAQMTDRLLQPALERGAIVISDRFFDSTTVYQGIARGLRPETAEEFNRFACGGLVPDLTLLLDLPAQEVMRRIRKRSEGANEKNGAPRNHGTAPHQEDRFDSESEAFHETVRRGFLNLARREPERFRIINAAESPDSVHRSIKEALRDGLDLF